MYYKKTHLWEVIINYSSYDSKLESYNYFNPWDFIYSDENTIVGYTYYNYNHSITINSKTLYNANQKIEEIKNIFKNEKNIIIKNKDIIWKCTLEEKKASIIISEWILKKLYSPYTKIGRKHIHKYYNDCL